MKKNMKRWGSSRYYLMQHEVIIRSDFSILVLLWVRGMLASTKEMSQSLEAYLKTISFVTHFSDFIMWLLCFMYIEWNISYHKTKKHK